MDEDDIRDIEAFGGDISRVIMQVKDSKTEQSELEVGARAIALIPLLPAYASELFMKVLLLRCIGNNICEELSVMCISHIFTYHPSVVDEFVCYACSFKLSSLLRAVLVDTNEEELPISIDTYLESVSQDSQTFKTLMEVRPIRPNAEMFEEAIGALEYPALKCMFEMETGYEPPVITPLTLTLSDAIRDARFSDVCVQILELLAEKVRPTMATPEIRGAMRVLAADERVSLAVRRFFTNFLEDEV